MQTDFSRKVPAALENLLNQSFASSGIIMIVLQAVLQADLQSSSTYGVHGSFSE